MTDTSQPMNFAELVDRLIPLFARLMTTLAYEDPVRMSFAEVGERTVLEIADLLKDKHGLTNQVVATTLGLTREGFRTKQRRFQSKHSDGFDGAPPCTEQVYEIVAARAESTIQRVEIEDIMIRRAAEKKDAKDQRTNGFTSVADEVRGVLRYLEDRHVIMGSGPNGPRRRYTLAVRPKAYDPTTAVQIRLYRNGKPMTAAEIERDLGLSGRQVKKSLARLGQMGLLQESAAADGQTVYTVASYHVPYGVKVDYPAVLWDHLRAVVEAVCEKVRLQRFGAQIDDHTGGMTYTFHLPVDDTFYGQVVGTLPEWREKMMEWLSQAKSLSEPMDPNRRYHEVTIYMGQMVREMSQRGE